MAGKCANADLDPDEYEPEFRQLRKGTDVVAIRHWQRDGSCQWEAGVVERHVYTPHIEWSNRIFRKSNDEVAEYTPFNWSHKELGTWIRHSRGGDYETA